MHAYGLETRLYLAESVPRAWTQYGNLICLLGNMARAKTHYHSHAIWIGEIDNLLDGPLPEFDPTNSAYAFAIAMIHDAAQRFGYDVVLGANPMIDPLTTLSMMLGPNQFYLEVIDRPEMIKRWTQRLGDMFMQIVHGYRQARAAHGRREDINWTGLWAPGDMDALQCDASALLSPEMFNEFALPQLERQAEFMDFGLWHLDGAGELPHIESICAVPGMRAIQWIDAQYAPQMKYIDAWKKIRKLGKSLMFSRCELDQAIALTRALGRDGLAFDLWQIQTEAEMESALRRLRNV